MKGYVRIQPHEGGWEYVSIYQSDGLLVASIPDLVWNEMKSIYGVNVDSDTFIEDVRACLQDFFNGSSVLGESWK